MAGSLEADDCAAIHAPGQRKRSRNVGRPSYRLSGPVPPSNAESPGWALGLLHLSIARTRRAPNPSRCTILFHRRAASMHEIWHQNFDPLGSPVLSTFAAAIPVCTLFYFLAVRRTAAWLAAVYSFAVGIAVALGIFHMPVHMAAGAVADGLVYGWLRIAWILVAAVFI